MRKDLRVVRTVAAIGLIVFIVVSVLVVLTHRDTRRPGAIKTHAF